MHNDWCDKVVQKHSAETQLPLPLYHLAISLHTGIYKTMPQPLFIHQMKRVVAGDNALVATANISAS